MNASSNQRTDMNDELTTDLLVFTIVTTVPIIIVGAFGNICVILAFLRKESLRTVSNYYTVVLMFFCLIGVIYLYPLQAMKDIFFFKTQPTCYFVSTPILSTSIHITFSLLATTVERYITICKPYTSHTILTPRRSVVILALIATYGYLYGIGVGGLVWIGKGHIWRQTRRCNFAFSVPSKLYSNILIAHWMIPIPIIAFINARIFFTVRRHIRQITAMQPAPRRHTTGITTNTCSQTGPHNESGLSSRQSGEEHPKRTRGRMMREVKSALLLFVVFALYVFNWVPIALFLATGVLAEEDISPKSYVLLHSFVYSTAVVCPYIYGFGNKTIRKEIKAIFCR